MPALSDEEMRALTAPLRTKAEKIRALGRAGVTAADIRRFLGIRYQHAYNVLKRAGIALNGRASGDGRAGTGRPARTVLDESGCIRIPDAIRESWGVAPGAELLLRLEGGELRVFTRAAGLSLAQGIVRRYLRGGESPADELIAERRREAGEDDDG